MAAAALLILAIAADVAGTVLLKVSDGFSKPLPAVGVVGLYLLSVWLLALVLRQMEIGFTYAVWSAVGTAAIAVVGVAVWDEPMNALKAASLGVVILGVVGLNISAAH